MLRLRFEGDYSRTQNSRDDRDYHLSQCCGKYPETKQTCQILWYPLFHRDISNEHSPVRIRVRIDSPHPLVCCKRRLNGAVLRMRPQKPRSRVTAGVAR
jgi:hypothetical protein